MRADILAALSICTPEVIVTTPTSQPTTSAAAPAALLADAAHSRAAVRIASAIAKAEPARVVWGGGAGTESLSRLLAASVLLSPAGTAAIALDPWCGRTTLSPLV